MMKLQINFLGANEKYQGVNPLQVNLENWRLYDFVLDGIEFQKIKKGLGFNLLMSKKNTRQIKIRKFCMEI